MKKLEIKGAPTLQKELAQRTIYIKYLEWDSSHFGIKVGELVIESSMTEESLLLAQERAKYEGYDLLYLRDVELDESLLSADVVLADQKVIYSKNICDTRFSKNDYPNVTSWVNHELDPQLFSLALQSGGHSRFYTDKRMPLHVFLYLYRTWIERSLEGTIATDVLVHRDKECNLGVLTYRQEGSKAEIGLLAIDNSVAGKGIGSHLMQSFLSRLPIGTTVEVATQKANTIACHFYEKNGFTQKSVTNIYHIWINK